MSSDRKTVFVAFAMEDERIPWIGNGFRTKSPVMGSVRGLDVVGCRNFHRWAVRT